jgi:hypothetical protein
VEFRPVDTRTVAELEHSIAAVARGGHGGLIIYQRQWTGSHSRHAEHIDTAIRKSDRSIFGQNDNVAVNGISRARVSRKRANCPRISPKVGPSGAAETGLAALVSVGNIRLASYSACPSLTR